MALECLPRPNQRKGRPGLGFAIIHQGLTVDYITVCWWDRQDELPTRIFVRMGTRWRPATTESFCVWDLSLMWFERCAYVASVLNDVEFPKIAYLGAKAPDTSAAAHRVKINVAWD